jgi:hypothetical protein
MSYAAIAEALHVFAWLWYIYVVIVTQWHVIRTKKEPMCSGGPTGGYRKSETYVNTILATLE